MNECTREIFQSLLRREGAWHRRTRKLLYEDVVQAASIIHEIQFMNEKWYPLYFRAVHLCKLLTCFPPEMYQPVFMDSQDVEGFAEDWVTDWLNQGYIGSLWDGRYWWAEDWSFDYPSEAELLSLASELHVVPGQRYQLSLFDLTE